MDAPTHPGRWSLRYVREPKDRARVYDVVRTSKGLRALINGSVCRCDPNKETVWLYLGPIPGDEPERTTP